MKIICIGRNYAEHVKELHNTAGGPDGLPTEPVFFLKPDTAVGKATAQVALHSGANDMGSIMIEENVVSSAGAHNQFDAAGIQQAIREAGFTPRLRDQLYRMR